MFGWGYLPSVEGRPLKVIPLFRLSCSEVISFLVLRLRCSVRTRQKVCKKGLGNMACMRENVEGQYAMGVSLLIGPWTDGSHETVRHH